MSTTQALTAIGALADPTRRMLYRYVAERGEAVSRDEAAEALGLPPAKARFHLDRLAEEGLLDTEYRRLTGRRGPGAGRPAKLYRRSRAEFEVSLPERRYDVLGDILATAIEQALDGADLRRAIAAAAYARGIEAAGGGDTADRTEGARDGGVDIGLRLAASTLRRLGYEARADDGALRLENCPFDALAQRHRALVCAANERFVRGALDAAGCTGLETRADPRPGACCVAVHRTTEGSAE